ncbi:MAG: flagellar motor switch protein FliN [Candidatus Baltobacteraceae bacterium]
MQKLADAMLVAAGTVLGRLVEAPASASAAARQDHEGSIRIEGDALVTLVEVPSIGAQVVVRFVNAEINRVVGMMIGGAEDAAEMGAMQLSIVSETVSQVASAMGEQLAKEIGAGTDGIRAALCSDATNLPPPPFESYTGVITVSGDTSPRIAIDFAAITLSKITSTGSEPIAPKPEQAPAAQVKRAGAAASAQPVSFSAMTPTPIKSAHPGGANLDLVHDVPLQISAVLGKTALPLREVVGLTAGSVFELDKNSTDPIDLYVNNILIARGEVVVVDDKFAVKISELNPSVG